MNTLPTELLQNIFFYCPNTLLNRVCKSWYGIVQDLINRNLLRENPHITGASLELFKQQKEIRYFVLKNLNSISLKYKITTLEFTNKLRVRSKPFLQSQFLVASKKLFIVTLKRIEIIDLKTTKREIKKIATLKDICFPPQLSTEDLSSDLTLNFERQNSTTYSCEKKIYSSNFSCVEIYSCIFDPQKQGLTFICKDKILHHNPDLAILYRNDNQLEIVEIATKKVIFSLKFPNLDKTCFHQDVLIITNEAGLIQGINVKEGKVLFERYTGDSALERLAMIGDNHFVMQIANKNQIEICSTITGQPLHILPLTLPFRVGLSAFYSLGNRKEMRIPFESEKFVALKENTTLCIVNTLTGAIEKEIKVQSLDFSVKIINSRLIISQIIDSDLSLDIYDFKTYNCLASHKFESASELGLTFDPLSLSKIGFGVFETKATQNAFILDLVSGKKNILFPKDIPYDGTRYNEQTQFFGENDYFVELDHKGYREKKLFKKDQYKTDFKIKIHHLSESIAPSKGKGSSSKI